MLRALYKIAAWVRARIRVIHTNTHTQTHTPRRSINLNYVRAVLSFTSRRLGGRRCVVDDVAKSDGGTCERAYS